MGKKHPGKITKQLVSLLAASAMVTSQVPANLSVIAVNSDTEQKQELGSVTDQDELKLSVEKNDVLKADLTLEKDNQELSETPTTTTTTNAAISSTTTTTTVNAPKSGKIQPNPTLSLDKTVISADKAGTTVPVNLYINDEAFGDEAYYTDASVYVDFDKRLSLQSAVNNDKNSGMYASCSKTFSHRNTYQVRVSRNYNNNNYGKNGVCATLNVTIPADAKPGDIYYFNICNWKGNQNSFSYSNSKIISNYNSNTSQTADNSSDKYLKGTTYDGYILIDPESKPVAAQTESDHELVLKDSIYYNVYSDHAEVAYADYELEEAVIPSEINDQKVTSISDNAFRYTNIKSVEIPDTVTAIGENAFNQSSLVSVKIPDSVESIGNAAFYDITSLKSVELPNNIKTIPSRLFASCSSLEALTIPESVETIDSAAFSYCTSLKEVNIPDGIKIIPSELFLNCKNLSEIKLPDSITSIDYSAFYATAIKTIDLPKSITSIGSSAFYNSALESIVIPDAVTSIGSSAFANCKALSSVQLPSTLKELNSGVFIDCSSLTSIKLPDTLTSIGYNAFRGSGLKEINIPESMTTLGSNCLAGTMIESFEIPEHITEIQSGVFMDCKSLKTVDLGSKINNMPSYLFQGCTSLEKISIPDTVKSLGTDVFSNSKIKEVNLPAALTSVSNRAFEDSNIETINYPDELTTLPTYAYSGAAKMSKVKLPASLTTLPGYVFSGCTSLTSFEIPESVTTISAYAFHNSYIKSLKLPSTVESIGNYALSGTKLETVEIDDKFTTLPSGLLSNSLVLKSVTLPSGLTGISSYFFNGCSSLTTVNIPDTVEKIDNYAFKNCTSLSELKLPSSLKEIGQQAFYNCNNLKELALPEKLETIRSAAFGASEITELKMPASIKNVQNAFSGSNIETITYPDSLTSLPSYAYSGASKMKTIKLPSKIAAIPSYCFSGCSSLEEFEIPSDIKTISSYAFSNSGVKDIKIPSTVDTIEKYAFSNSSLETADIDEKFTELPVNLFYGSSKLKSVNLPSELTVIAAYTFYNCASLESIKLPEKLETIGNYAFYNTGLTSIDIPDSVKNINESAFAYSKSLEKVKLPSGLTTIQKNLFNYCNSLTDITLPEAVTSIGANAFGLCNSLTKLTLPEKLESIGTSAFSSSGLKELTIPDSVNSLNNSFSGSNIETITYSDSRTTLPSYAYAGASKMVSVKLPSNVTSIPPYAFSGCSTLEKVEIPSTVTKIGQYAFNYAGIKELKLPKGVEQIGNYAFNNSQLESVEIPDTVTELNNYAFSSCRYLKDVKLPDTLTSIGVSGFNSCTSLTSINIPDSVQKIENNAFNGCTSLEKIKLPEAVETINSQTFYNCTALKDITLPKIKILGDYALSGCTSLESIELPDTLTTIGNAAFNNCTSLSDIKLPESLTSIGNNAFYNNTSLAALEIPDSVTRIGSTAFYNTGLKKLIIPDTVTLSSTGSLFDGCKYLEEVHLPKTLSSLDSYCFRNCTSLKSVDLPDGLSYIRNNAFIGTTFTTLYIPASVSTINSNALANSKIDTIYGYKGSAAETFAKNNNLTFVEHSEQTWNEKDSLPTFGIYKLECDVTTDKELTISSMLELDLNGHKVVCNRLNVNGNMTVKDSSEDKSGSMSSYDKNELFSVTGTLKLLGGTLTGNAKSIDTATISMRSSGNLVLDGAKVISHYSNAISAVSHSGTIDLISGSLEENYKAEKGSNSVYSAVHLNSGFTGTFNLSGATITADKGCGIYSDSSRGTINVTSGKISSTSNYGIYCPKGTKTALSGKLDISGGIAGIYVPGGVTIDITDKLTGGKVSIEAEKTGIFTNGYAKFNKDSAPSSFFSVIKNCTLSAADSGELICNVPVTTTTTTSTTTTTTTTTTSTTTSKPTTTSTTSTTTSKPTTTSTTSTTTSTSTSTSTNTSPTQTSSKTTSSTTSSTTSYTTNTTMAITPPVEPTHTGRLDIDGELTVKPMTKEEVKAAGIDLTDDDNFNSVKYEIKAEFEAAGVVIDKYVTYDKSGSVAQKNIAINVSGHGTVVISSDPKKPTYVPALGAYVVHEETAKEEMYMFIYGHCKWLKEFYDVQLIVVNKDTETLKNCKTTLNVPDGLTLTKSEQTQELGDLAPNGVFDVHWYLRGDKEGDYDLSAVLTGTNAGEAFDYTFKTKESLHVYSSSALNMEIELPRYSYYNEKYPIKIKLKNVSDKPVYDLENAVKGFDQASYAVFYHTANGDLKNVNAKAQALSYRGNIATINVDELQPGESAVIELYVPDLWKSVYEQYIDAERFDANTIRLLTSLSNNPDILAINKFYTLYEKALGELPTEHILKNVSVNFFGSELTIPYKVNIIEPTTPSNGTVQIIRTNAAINRLHDVFNAKEPKTAFEKFKNEYIYNADTSGTRDDVTDFNKYLSDIFTGKTNTGYIDIAKDMFFIAKPNGSGSVKIYVETVNGGVRKPLAGNKYAASELTADNNAFTITDMNGSKPDADGKLTISDETAIKITANDSGKYGIVHVEYADGTKEEYNIHSSEEHECKSTSGFQLVSAPVNGKAGYAVQLCDTCGEITDSLLINSRATAMLSNKNTYADVKIAVDDAVEAGKKTELSLFGNINVQTEIIIPDYIDVLIAPNTKITFSNGGKLVAKGKVNDFSGKNYDLSGKVVTTTSTTTSTTNTTTTTTAATSTNSTSSATASSSTSSNTTSTATTTSNTSTSATTTVPKKIASDEELCNWAVKDYKKKNISDNVNAEITSSSDTEYKITLTDDDGNVLDVYTIDPTSGKGKNSANENVSLPQTGNNSMSNWLALLGSMFLIGLGAISVKLSGIFRRKKDEQ